MLIYRQNIIDNISKKYNEKIYLKNEIAMKLLELKSVDFSFDNFKEKFKEISEIQIDALIKFLVLIKIIYKVD